MMDSTGLARVLVRATALPFGAIGFDCLLAAAFTGRATMLLQAAILMGIATALLWGSDRL